MTADPTTEPVDGSPFGVAVERLREGKRVTRRAWSTGVVPWLVLVPGSSFPVDADRPMGKAAPEWVGRQATYAPHIDIVTPTETGIISQPWVATTRDVLAQDWTQVT